MKVQFNLTIHCFLKTVKTNLILINKIILRSLIILIILSKETIIICTIIICLLKKIKIVQIITCSNQFNVNNIILIIINKKSLMKVQQIILIKITSN